MLKDRFVKFTPLERPCPTCKMTVQFSAEKLGQTIKCPHCGNRILLSDTIGKSSIIFKN